jgi:hypothetical protein
MRALRSPRIRVEPIELVRQARVRRLGLPSLKGIFRRRTKPEPSSIPSSPVVILACEKCGFNYRIERIDFGQGRIGAFWMCACGSRYIPPGGEESYHLLRP